MRRSLGSSGEGPTSTKPCVHTGLELACCRSSPTAWPGCWSCAHAATCRTASSPAPEPLPAGAIHLRAIRRWGEARPVHSVGDDVLAVLNVDSLDPVFRLRLRPEHVEVAIAVEQEDGAGHGTDGRPGLPRLRPRPESRPATGTCAVSDRLRGPSRERRAGPRPGSPSASGTPGSSS
jgi:hypothetical protein